MSSSEVVFNNGNWLKADNPHQRDLDHFTRTFTSDKKNIIILVKLKNDTYFTKETIRSLYKLTKNIEKIENVHDILTPLAAQHFYKKNNNVKFVSFDELLQNDSYNYSIDEYRNDLKISQYYNSIISEDFKSFLIIVDIMDDTVINDNLLFGMTTKNIDTLLKDHVLFGDYYYSGNDYSKVHINQSSMDGAYKILIIILLIIGVVVFIAHKNWLHVFIVLYTVFLSVLFTFSVFNIFNYAITTVSTILLALILVIAVSDVLYIINIWSIESKDKSNPKVIQRTMIRAWRPCLITSISTAIGFGSFYFSDILPFRELGIVSSISIMGSYLIITFTTWIGLYILNGLLKKGPYVTTENILLDRFLNKISRLCTHNTKRLIFIIVFSHTVILMFQNGINFQSNSTEEFLDKKKLAYAGYRHINRDFHHYNNIELIFDSKEDGYFSQIENLNKINSIKRDLLNYRYITNIESYIDSISMLHRILSENSHIPETQEELSQELLFIEFLSSSDSKELLFPYVDFNYSSARIHIKVNKRLDNEETEDIVQHIQNISGRHIEISPTVTGDQIYSYQISNNILDTQLVSALFMIFCVFLLFVIVFGLKLGALGTFSNTLPIFLVIGLISCFNINFDFAVVLALNINFGIMVDMSVHLLHNYLETARIIRSSKANKGFFVHYIHILIQASGKPITYIFIILLCCDFLFINSDIFLLQKFGLFSALMLLSSVIVNLLLIPATIYLFIQSGYKLKALPSKAAISIKNL